MMSAPADTRRGQLGSEVAALKESATPRAAVAGNCAIVIGLSFLFQLDARQRAGLLFPRLVSANRVRLLLFPGCSSFVRAPVLSIQVNIAQWFAGSWSFFRLPDCLAEFFVEKILLILFGIDGLTEDALLALILFAHGAGGGFEILEHALAGSGCVRHHGTGTRVDLQDAATIRAGDLKHGIFLIRSTHESYCMGIAGGNATPAQTQLS